MIQFQGRVDIHKNVTVDSDSFSIHEIMEFTIVSGESLGHHFTCFIECLMNLKPV